MSVFEIIPGQNTIESRTTDRMEIETIEFAVGAVTLTADLLLPRNAPEHATPLIGKLRKGSLLLWNFQCKDFDGRAHLIYVNDQAVIAYVNRDQVLTKIETIESIVSGQPTGIKATVQLKYAAAEFIGCDHVELSKVEAKVSAKLDEERAEQAKADLAARAAERQRQNEERAALREARRQSIMARQELKLRTSSGKILHGRPVVGDEWQCLADGTWVVRVSAYLDGVTGDLIEHGVVSKKGGQVKLAALTTDLQFADRDQQPTAEVPTPLGIILLEIENDVHEVSLYAAKDVKQLKKLGILGLFATKNGDELIVGKVVDQNGTIMMKMVTAKEFA